MDKEKREQREQLEYERKTRRNVRKNADKVYIAYKRAILSKTSGVAQAGPILKIDVMPKCPDEELISVVDEIATFQNLIIQYQGIPHDIPTSTVGGFVVNSDLSQNSAFDQLFVGANGHIGLRIETTFGDVSRRQIDMNQVLRRLNIVLDIAQKVYKGVQYEDGISVRVELLNVRDWSIYIGQDFDAVEAILSQYATESTIPKIMMGGFDGPNTAISLGGELQWQLGFSSVR